MIIRSRNILHETAPKSYLSNTEAAGTTIFRIRNTNSFGSSWAIQIGEVGEEQTEVLILSGNPGAGTLGTTTAASRFEHPADSSVYAIKFNQVVFERSTTGTAGTATPMTDGTITYQPDSWDMERGQSYTIFDDTSGSASYAYRVRYRNSVLGTNTIQSDWQTSAGFSFYSLASIRQRGRDKLWNADFLQDDMLVNNWINEWKDEMANAVIAVNQDYSLGTVDVSFGTAGLGTITTGDFKSVRRFETTYNGQDFYLSTKSYVNEYYPDQIFSSTHPFHHWVANNVFKVQPAESGGTARLTIYQFGTTLVNDTDELPNPMRSYTKSFVDYIEAQALRKDQKQDWVAKMAEANASKADFVSKLSPRDQTSQSVVRMTEAISGEDQML